MNDSLSSKHIYPWEIYVAAYLFHNERKIVYRCRKRILKRTAIFKYMGTVLTTAGSSKQSVRWVSFFVRMFRIFAHLLYISEMI